MTCEILRTTAELEALRGEWTALLHRTGICTPFLTWEWMCTWWQHYCADDPARRLAVVVARRQGHCEAILPGYIRSSSGLTFFEFLGTEYESTDYTRTIEPIDAEGLLGELLEALMAQEPRLDIIHLTNVLDSDSTLPRLRRFAASASASYESELFRTCPIIHIRGNWDAFVEGLSAKMRKNVRRAMRQLLDAGAEFKLVTDREGVRPAVRDLFALHAERFVTKKATTGFRADLREPFHAAVAERFFDSDLLRLFRLELKGRAVASVYCFEHQGGLFYFQGGMDPEFERLSVGTALVGHAIKYAFDQQLRFFDFMRGEEAYKFRWTQDTRDIMALRLGVSGKGRAALFARRRLLAAKGLVKRLLFPSAAPAAESAAGTEVSAR